MIVARRRPGAAPDLAALAWRRRKVRVMTDTADAPDASSAAPLRDRPVHRKPHSYIVTDGIERAAARGMLRAVGMGDDDWRKPQIGVASSWNEITPCNLSLARLAKAAKQGVFDADGYPLEFGTISVSDGISMGHGGMHYSLVSREVIADSVETVFRAEQLDGGVLLAGCDKSEPGMLMAAARLDVAAVFLYAGSTLPGQLDGETVTIIDAFEAVGACLAGKITRQRLDDDREGHLPRRGRLRRHVHRQHDGQRGRGARHVAARQRRPAGPRRPPRLLRGALGRGRRQAGRRRDHRQGHPDQEGLRERDHRRHGAGRIDERGAAPAGDRPRGRRRAHPRRLQPDRRPDPAPGRRQAVRPVRDDRHRPDRRRAGGDEGAAGRRPAARRRADRHRQDDGREPRRAEPARAGRRGAARDDQPDPPHRRASRSCRARSRPRVPW